MIAQGAQLLIQVPRRIEAPRWVLLQAAIHHPLQRHRDLALKRLRLFANNGRHGFHRGAARKCLFAAQHLIHNQAERKLVGVVSRLLSPRLLGAHVRRRSQNHPGAGHVLSSSWTGNRCCGSDGLGVGTAGGRCPHDARQPKIQNFYPSVSGHHYVLRLQVPMHNSRCVRGRHSVGNLRCQLHHMPHRHCAMPHLLPQQFAVYQLAHRVLHAVDVAHFIQRHNIWMAQGSDSLGLALKPRPPVGVARNLSQQNLQRNVAIQA